MSTLKVNTVQHNTSGFNNVVQFTDGAGTENGTLCRAWVLFDANGTLTITDDFNVSSVTDSNTGRYVINFDNALPHANYVFLGMVGMTGTSSESAMQVNDGVAVPSTTTCTIRVTNTSSQGYVDKDRNSMAFFA